MNAYDTKEDLIEGYAKLANKGLDEKDNEYIPAYLYSHKAIYNPSQYRGGFVIRGFGFSTERILAGYCTLDNCGNPEAV